MKTTTSAVRAHIRTALALAVAAGAWAALPAQAYEAGDWLVKLGVTDVIPKSNNGSVLGGTVGLDVDNSVRPSITGTYMVTRNLGVELLAAVPFHHNVSGAGLGNIASTKQLPPTLSAVWYFMPDSRVQPYVGLGLNYTTFFDVEGRGALAGSDVHLDKSWGVAAQVGVDVKFDDHWLFNASLRYIDISTKVRVNGAEVGTAKISPWVPTIAVGYRF